MSLLLMSLHCERAVSLSGGSLRLSEVLKKIFGSSEVHRVTFVGRIKVALVP